MVVGRLCEAAALLFHVEFRRLIESAYSESAFMRWLCSVEKLFDMR